MNSKAQDKMFEVDKELDLEIPQHFTKEQSIWIKKYCIERNKEFYNQAVEDCCKIISNAAGEKYIDGFAYAIIIGNFYQLKR